MKAIFASFIAALFSFIATDKLTGRWESKSEKGNITGVVFKENNSFEGYINKKPFVTGTYSYSSEDSIFVFTDNGCNGQTGTYKINFYANGDSLRFKAIIDSCAERKAVMERLIMGRVK